MDVNVRETCDFGGKLKLQEAFLTDTFLTGRFVVLDSVFPTCFQIVLKMFKV